ncbi:ABC transporter substrate-binding protein, partial [Burkholderia multivorans]
MRSSHTRESTSPRRAHRRLTVLGAAVAISALALSGCGNQKGQGNDEAGSGTGSDGDVTIALL